MYCRWECRSALLRRTFRFENDRDRPLHALRALGQRQLSGERAVDLVGVRDAGAR